MNATKLQIPLRIDLKKKADKKAKKQGFSSLQEVIRVFLTGYVEGKFSPTFVNTDTDLEKLTPAAEERLWKIKEELDKEIEEGTAFTANSEEELMQNLNIPDEEDKLILRPTITIKEAKGMFKDKVKRVVSDKEIEKAIEESIVYKYSKNQSKRDGNL